MTDTKKWKVRRNGQIRGPYTFQVLEKLARLGRLKQTDELSSNDMDWKTAGSFAALFKDTDVERLLKDDERSGWDRRENDASSRDQQKRQGKDRRQPEPEDEVSRRRGRTKLLETIKESRVEDHFPLLTIIASIVIIVFLGFVLTPSKDILSPDCDASPNPGVIWDNCKFGQLTLKKKDLSGASIRNAVLKGVNFQEANLRSSNFSYTDLSKSNLKKANLEKAVLKGANLQFVNLASASLIDADLSHADLRGSNLEDADFTRTILDKAIWEDGKVCGRDSVGVCRPE